MVLWFCTALCEIETIDQFSSRKYLNKKECLFISFIKFSSSHNDLIGASILVINQDFPIYSKILVQSKISKKEKQLQLANFIFNIFFKQAKIFPVFLIRNGPFARFENLLQR